MAVSPSTDFYAVLGVGAGASTAELKAAYRALVKRHHPDAGGDERTILALNAAWEVLRDRERRRHYDRSRGCRSVERSPMASGDRVQARPGGGTGATADGELHAWMQRVYAPIDRLLGQVINAFPAELRALAADPYDDELMEVFCNFLSQSQAKLERVNSLYASMACPASAGGFGISLYHCLSQVQDALTELERYTMGYVDSYLHDGREMLREAKRHRMAMQQDRPRLEF
jgi:molecular chaperone DnaJ